MAQNRAYILLVMVVTTVFFIAPPPVSTQETPPRPYRSIEEIPQRRNPNAPVKTSGSMIDNAPAYVDGVYDWSSRVWQSYQSGNWEIRGITYGEYTVKTIGASSATDIQPNLNRGASHVVFVSNRNDAYEIYRMTIDGTDITRLTFSGSDNVNPAWSPDGSKIVFQSYRNGQAEIYVMNAEGSNQTRLTNNADYDGMPAWSPDGSKIAFASRRNGMYLIYMMNADGSGVTQLSSQPYSANPAWSPDGTKIAYDADLDGDGWQELWVMDADGSNQQQLHNPSGQTDAWVSGWSPDGALIHYTLISFVNYQGNWYWVDAYLDAYHLIQGSTQRLVYDGREWNLDWQTADLLPPDSMMNVLPAQSTNQFVVSWSGQDTGPAGISGYDLRYKIGAAGTWATLLNESSATFYEYRTGIGGETIYFQVRAYDEAGNIEAWKPNNIIATTIESQPPQTQVKPLETYTRLTEPLLLDWTGQDPGGSGVAEYEIQYRIDNGNWTAWATVTEGPYLFENILGGHTYYFQVRGVDRAENRESWTGGDGDAATTVYATAISGQAMDNGGTQIQGLTLATTPASFEVVNGDANGRYAGYLATQPISYTAQWAKGGYGDLPVTTFTGTTNVQLPIVLPPADNIINNSGFETGNFTPAWLPGGSATPHIMTTIRQTGLYAAFFGQTDDWFDNGRFLGISGSSMQMAIDKNQNAHVVLSNGSQLIYAQRAAGEWLPNQALPTNIAEEIKAVQLAVDDSLTLHLTWQTYEGVYYIQKPDGSTWTAPLTIAESGSPWDRLQMKVTNSGIVHVLWQQSGGSDLYYRQRLLNGTWSSTQTVSPSATFQKMVVDEAGSVHVVWSSIAGASIDIFYSHSLSGGGWTSPQNISQQPSSHSLSPDLIAGVDGTVHVAWYYQGDNGLYYTHCVASGVCSAPFRFTDGSSLSYLATDVNQNLHIIFGGGTGQRAIKSITRDQNGGWSPVSSLYFAAENLQAVVDHDGLAHIVYQDPDNAYRAFYIYQTGIEGWSQPQQLLGDPSTATFFDMQMRLDEYGHTHILWRSAYSRAYYAGPTWSATADSFLLSQQITIPLTMTTPVMSFLYQASDYCSAVSCLELEVDNGTTISSLWSLSGNDPGWNHGIVDLSSWAGQTVSLIFRLEQTAGAPLAWVSLDEVTLGAAHPDVWVTIANTQGLRNEQVVQTISYGNRGHALASGVRLTATLPAELTFVGASQPPVSTAPLVWELGDLPGQNEPLLLSVTVQIEPTAVSFSTIFSSAFIQTAGDELEMLNNSVQGQTYIGRHFFLPTVMR